MPFKPPPGIPPFDPSDFPVSRTMRDMQLAAMDSALTRAETALAFLQARIEADRRLGHALAAAGSAAEAMQLWGEYWQETLRDYSVQSTALAADCAVALERGVEAMGGMARMNPFASPADDTTPQTGPGRRK